MDTSLVKDFLSDLSETIGKIEENNPIIRDFGCVDGTIIGTGRSDYTKDSTTYNLSINGKNFALIDIPGIEGDESAFKGIIKHSLERAHVIFYVNGSGKKIEKESLKKIKKYMHDGTSVYAIFNTHCKAKKERIPGIDKSYSDDLKDAYKKQNKIITQTENRHLRCLVYLAVTCNYRLKKGDSIYQFNQKKRQQAASPLKPKAANIAAADKLLVVIYSLMKNGSTFRS